MSEPSSPFYAVILAGRMECPLCGRILTWSATGRPNSLARASREICEWNPITSTITCTHCHKGFQVGILAWPVDKRRWKDADQLPPGQRPSVRQMAEIRQYAKGFFTRRVRGHREGTNQYVPEGCNCNQNPWLETCPVHGEQRIDVQEQDEGGESPEKV